MLVHLLALLGGVLLLILLMLGHYHVTKRVWAPKFEEEAPEAVLDEDDDGADVDDREEDGVDDREGDRWDLDDGWL